jgi:hypothetical protein
MDDINLTPAESSIGSDATRALVVSAASVAGTLIGFAVVAGAVAGVDKVRTTIANRKAKKLNA